MSWTILACSEAGLSVPDTEAWERFFSGTGCWEVLHRGTTPAPTRAAWPGQAHTTVHEVLLGRPGAAAGYVRLFHFELEGQREIRGHAMPWDTGGIFDLDVRVADMAVFLDGMTAAGWGSIGGPVEWCFGDLRIVEWLALGPQSVVLALVQRLHPPLEGAEPGAGLGHVFNSSQTVRDIGPAVDFYRRLGFQQVVAHHGPLAGRGGEVLGLAPEAAPSTPVDLVIMSPDGTMNGSVELVALPTVSGRDLSGRAMPQQLGLNLLRFPVRGIEAFARHLASHGLAQADSIFETELAPRGPVRQINLQSPDGAWLEFYEELP